MGDWHLEFLCGFSYESQISSSILIFNLFQISVFIGPVSMVLLSVFGFAIRLADIPLTFKWLHYFSFIRSSYQSLLYAMYGMKRSPLPCDSTYCHFRPPMQFMKEMDVTDFEMVVEFLYICFICILVYVCTSFCIWYRLNKR